MKPFLLAVGIGALFGMERERDKVDRLNFGGFRTFTLISLLGALTGVLAQHLSLPWILPMVFGGLVILIALAYFFTAKAGYLGIITELSTFLCFLLGYLVTTDLEHIALLLVVAIVIIIELDFVVHKFVKETNEAEWLDTLKFAAVALIILPLLPDKALDPWGLINPYTTWLLVVLISGLEFIGYFLMKLFGSQVGIPLMGFLGGLVSSTATTASLTAQSKKYPHMAPILSFGVVISSVTMFARILTEVGLVSFDLFMMILPYLAIPMLVLLLSGFATIIPLWFGKKSETATPAIALELDSPFSFKPAFTMAILFTVVKVIAKIAQFYLGDAGIYLTSGVSGLVDTDALTITLSSLYQSNQLALSIAMQGIVIGVLTNNAVKGFLAYSTGEKEYGKKVLRSFGLTLVAGIIMIGFLLLK